MTNKSAYYLYFSLTDTYFNLEWEGRGLGGMEGEGEVPWEKVYETFN